MEKFTVLMSVYEKEKPEYLFAAVNSVLKSTVHPSEIIIVKDGPLTLELEKTLEKFGEERITILSLEKNGGLSKALNFGLKHVKTRLVARMDTDDICRPDRFEKQLELFDSNQDLIVVGSNVSEFIASPNEIVSYKKMPLDPSEIYKYSRKRNPFNHPTVMYSKPVIDQVGGYSEMPLFEDYYLWLKIMKEYGVKGLVNINDDLVSMRTVDDLYKRRGGFSYLEKVLKFRYTCLQEGSVSFLDFTITTTVGIVVSIVPNSIRKLIYKKVLR